MSVKFNQSRHQFSDSALSRNIEHVLKESQNGFFKIIHLFFYILPFFNYNTSVKIKKWNYTYTLI